MKIGVVQVKNSTSIEGNFNTIKNALSIYEKNHVDLILFPECSLSGFSAKMRECTYNLISDHLSVIEDWAHNNNTYVFLPTALKENEEIFNTGFILGGSTPLRFYKVGLTGSEKGFFSAPSDTSRKVFDIKGQKVAVLICYEAQMDPWRFFKDGDVDIILWPGYWGWEKEDRWDELKTDGGVNPIFDNMNLWKRPLIQSNFAFNELAEHRSSGPNGLSMFVNQDNTLFAQGDYQSEACYQIEIENNVIIGFSIVGKL